MTTPTLGHEAATGHPAGRRFDPLPTLTAIWAAAHTLFGLWWLAEPSAWPFSPGDAPSSLLQLVDPRIGAGLFAAAAGAGLVAALAMRRHRSPATGRVLLVIAVVEAVLFTIVVPDIHAIVYLGYLTALCTPCVLVALAIVGSVRHWQIRIFALTLVALGVIAFATGWLTLDVVGEVVGGIAVGFAKNGVGPLHILAILAGGVAWTGMAVRQFRQLRERCPSCGRPGASWTAQDAAARWGKWVTLGAMCCPLPYALARLSWLTPWPLHLDPATLAANPGIRLFGLFLGCAALVGTLLTSGLISRWGERWPFWMPGLAGRPIPWPVAVVPATVVTGALLACSQGITVMTVDQLAGGDTTALWMYGVLPFGLWGALLGAATLAYYYRRRSTCQRCHTG